MLDPITRGSGLIAIGPVVSIISECQLPLHSCPDCFVRQDVPSRVHAAQTNMGILLNSFWTALTQPVSLMAAHYHNLPTPLGRE